MTVGNFEATSFGRRRRECAVIVSRWNAHNSDGVNSMPLRFTKVSRLVLILTFGLIQVRAVPSF